MTPIVSGAYPFPNCVWAVQITAPRKELYSGLRLEMNPGSFVRAFYAVQTETITQPTTPPSYPRGVSPRPRTSYGAPVPTSNPTSNGSGSGSTTTPTPSSSSPTPKIQLTECVAASDFSTPMQCYLVFNTAGAWGHVPNYIVTGLTNGKLTLAKIDTMSDDLPTNAMNFLVSSDPTVLGSSPTTFAIRNPSTGRYLGGNSTDGFQWYSTQSSAAEFTTSNAYSGNGFAMNMTPDYDNLTVGWFPSDGNLPSGSTNQWAFWALYIPNTASSAIAIDNLVSTTIDNPVQINYGELNWFPLSSWQSTDNPELNFNFPVVSDNFMLEITNLPPVMQIPSAPKYDLLPQQTGTLQIRQALPPIIEAELNSQTRPMKSPIDIKPVQIGDASTAAVELPYYGYDLGYVMQTGDKFSQYDISVLNPTVGYHGVPLDFNSDIINNLPNPRPDAPISYMGVIDDVELIPYSQSIKHSGNSITVFPYAVDFANQFHMENSYRTVSSPDQQDYWLQKIYITDNSGQIINRGYFPDHPELNCYWNSTTSAWNADDKSWGLLHPPIMANTKYQGQTVSRVQNTTNSDLSVSLGTMTASQPTYFGFVMTYCGYGSGQLKLGNTVVQLNLTNNWQTIRIPSVKTSTEVSPIIELTAGSFINISSMYFTAGINRLYLTPAGGSQIDITPVFEQCTVSFGQSVQNYTLSTNVTENALLPSFTLDFHI